MLRRFGEWLDQLSRAITPDPFVLAIGLTVLTAALALVLTPSTMSDVLAAWQGPRGFWGLLAFTMQMCLVLVTGHALASAPVIDRAIRVIAGLPKTGPGAAALVAAVAVLASMLNWGFALVLGALVAREVGRSCHARGISVHYPMLAAAGYLGMMTWHGGFSGSAPLKVTTTKDLVELLGPELGQQIAPIPLSETTLGPMNLFITGGLLVLVPLLAWLVSPKSGDARASFAHYAPGAVETSAEGAADEAGRFVDRVETSRVTTMLLLVPLVAWLVKYYAANGLATLDPNALNLTLLALGLFAHGTPRAYGRAVAAAVPGTTGIMLQFPLYAGIMGIMAGTGLAKVVATWAAGAGSGPVYLVATFLAAGLINLFIPSGGGQWAVQGPVAIEAARTLGLPLGGAVMAVAYGDQWTNMLQPFWALPLIGITGVPAREIVGYSAAIMVISGLWIALGLALFG
ncbi:TIGR00366 family protein [Myxococcota bacterium]|nr:TIGR00366 family protein [Myxococcota bacterium]